MILHTSNTTTEAFGTSETQTFGMQQSRKAFNILSDLYSDKHLAIVRELGCNAKDSMRDAGKADQPFHIHLPNSLEPWLTIKDFGTGIAHDKIYGVYTVYFASTKTNSPDDIGCLGLGSKSPFSDCDNFTVTSIHGGEQRIYNAYFNEAGLPTIALMSVCHTTESSGLSVQIPIKAENFELYRKATYNAFKYFDVKPVVTGGVIDWSDTKPTFEGDGWKFYEGMGTSESVAIMGGVNYPINAYHVDSEHRRLLNAGVVLYFNLGDLDFAPSREALAYDAPTVKALNDKLAFVKTDFAEKFAQTIEDKADIMEALIAAKLYSEKFSFLNSSLKQNEIMWKGIDITHPETYLRKTAQISLMTNPFHCHTWRDFGRKKFYESSSEAKLQIAETAWYYNDLNRGAIARIKNLIRDAADDARNATLFTQESYEKLILEGFPAKYFKPVSSLPKPFSVARCKTTNTILGVKIYNATYNNKWVAEEYDSTNPPQYYIVKNGHGYDFNIGTKHVRCYNQDDIENICNYMKIDSAEVCMVSKRFEKMLIADGVKSFADYIKNEPALAPTIDAETYTISQFGPANYEIGKFWNDPTFKALDPNHDIKKLFKKITNARKNMESYGSLFNFPEETKWDWKPEISDPMHQFLFGKIGAYAWDAADIMTILTNYEKKGLTNP